MTVRICSAARLTPAIASDLLAAWFKASRNAGLPDPQPDCHRIATIHEAIARGQFVDDPADPIVLTFAHGELHVADGAHRLHALAASNDLVVLAVSLEIVLP